MLTQKGSKIYQVLSGRENAYLINSRGFWILLDTGRAHQYEKLKKRIDKLIPIEEKLNMLFLTHTHYDHCQNAYQLKTDYGCNINVSQAEKDYIKKGYTPIPKGTKLLSKVISFLGRTIEPPFAKYIPFEKDWWIDEEFMIKNDMLDFRAIKTPGHSAGSISLIIDSEIAFVGDAMFGVFKNSIFPPFADDETEMIRSWGKLLETNCEVFLPGHGREINRTLLEKEYKKYASRLAD